MKSLCAARTFSLALLGAVIVSCSPLGAPPSLGGATGAVPEARTQVRAQTGTSSPVIYVANMAGMKNGGTVTVYSGAGKFMRTLHKGITSPTAFAFDKLGDVYVLNSMPSGPGTGGSVSVYSHGGKKFLGQIRNGIGAPVGLALDASNNIYVANAGSSSSPGNVVVFKAGTATLLGAITKGISFPTDIGTDCNGKLYVLNGGNNTVTEYGGRHLKLMLTIHNMTTSTGLMVTCQGNVFVSQAASTSAIKRPLSATPTPTPSPAPSGSPSPSPSPSIQPSSTPTPYSTPGGSVTEFAPGSTIVLETMPVDGGVPCNMASDPSSGMTWIEACSFSGANAAMLYGYPEDESMETIAIPLPPLSADAQFLLIPPSSVVPQTTLAIPRTSTTAYDLRSNSYPYYPGGELVFYNTAGVQTEAVPESSLGVAVAIASN